MCLQEWNAFLNEIENALVFQQHRSKKSLASNNLN